MKFDKRMLVLLCGWVAGQLGSPPAGRAQDGEPVPVQYEAFAGGELEGYLRLLQVTGASPLYPWSLRGFSPAEVANLGPRDAPHPWEGRYRFEADSADGPRWSWLRPTADVVYNSSRPHGANDGAVWAGKGTTLSVQAGLAARYGALSLTLSPVVFWAENRDFDLAPNGETGRLAFADPAFPYYIDSPQRFGDEAYSRIDPGQSSLRLDLPQITLGVSTANQFWGPAARHPFLLGNNAAGFPHFFVGTGSPLGIGIGRLHGRAVWGRLDHSEYSAAEVLDDAARRRIMSGLVLAFLPRGMPGLEIGAARFFHTPSSGGGIGAGHLLKPFEGLLKEGLERKLGGDGSDADNQLASAFVRWVLPKSGFEVYGEYGRDDHSYDVRDLVLEPDHNSAYLLGFAKVWRASDPSWFVLRGEVFNSRASHLIGVRDQVPLYLHSPALQGHTQRGQVLGSPFGLRGGGSVLAVDRFTDQGRWTLEWTRMSYPARRVGEVGAVKAEALLFRNPYEVIGGVEGVYDLSPHARGTLFNLQGRLGLRVGI